MVTAMLALRRFFPLLFFVLFAVFMGGIAFWSSYSLYIAGELTLPMAAGFALGTIAFVFFVALGMIRIYIIRPISTLIAGAHRLEEGEWEEELSFSGNNEFQLLAVSFNRIAKHLTQLTTEMKRQERHALFGRLSAGLVHDLKHPVQSIENCGKNLDRAAEDPILRDAIQKTFKRELQKINQFLEDLRQLTHEMPYVPVSLSLQGAIDEIVSSFSELASQQGVTLIVEMPGESLAVSADRFGLNRLLSNLVSNAIQAIPGSGQITIRLRRAPNETVAIDVEDNGTGIPPDRLANIFEEFWTTKTRGLGLGLAIAKKIATLHGGRIEVRSEVGKGTTFSVYLPA